MVEAVRRAYVADACALLRLAQDEPGADRVATVLSNARADRCRVLLHQINFGEVVSCIGERFGWTVAERKRHEILLLPLEIVPFSDDLFWEAVKLKAAHPLSYADCFAAALPLREGATLLTSDPEFGILGPWLCRKNI